MTDFPRQLLQIPFPEQWTNRTVKVLLEPADRYHKCLSTIFESGSSVQNPSRFTLDSHSHGVDQIRTMSIPGMHLLRYSLPSHSLLYSVSSSVPAALLASVQVKSHNTN